MKTEKKSIEAWVELVTKVPEENSIPIFLQSTSSSMFPLIRPETDEVTVIPCSTEEVEVGDVVLIKAPQMPAGYILHRLMEKRNGFLRTIGDANSGPDVWVDASSLLGKAIMVCGPDKKVDCTSAVFKRHGRRVIRFYRLRPVFFMSVRLKNGLARFFSSYAGQ